MSLSLSKIRWGGWWTITFISENEDAAGDVVHPDVLLWRFSGVVGAPSKPFEDVFFERGRVSVLLESTSVFFNMLDHARF